MKVFFSDRAFTAILAETTEKVKTETGGLFLGIVENDTWYVVEAIDPGPKSIFEVAYFEYDQKYTQHLINKIANLYETPLQLIGLWHRHPGSFDQFSSTDDGTNHKYASMRQEGAISALVNIDPEFRLTVYHTAYPCKYHKIPYKVGNQFFPERLLAFKSEARYKSMMDSILHRQRRDSSGGHISVSLASFMSFVTPMLKEFCVESCDTEKRPAEEQIQNHLVETALSDLTYMGDKLHIEASITMSGNRLTLTQETLMQTTEVFFLYSAEKDDIFLAYNGCCYRYHDGLLVEAFKKAKAAQDENCPPVREEKQPGIIGSVIRLIRPNGSEDKNEN